MTKKRMIVGVWGRKKNVGKGVDEMFLIIAREKGRRSMRVAAPCNNKTGQLKIN